MFEKIVNNLTYALNAFKNIGSMNVKDLMIGSAHNTTGNNWSIAINGTVLNFKSTSWSKARADGKSFVQMLQRVDKRTYIFLEKLCRFEDIVSVDISSLWRPKGIHGLGLGIDISMIVTTGGTAKFVRNNNAHMCSAINDLIRLRIWNTNRVKQWIGPWKKRGVKGEALGWLENIGKRNVKDKTGVDDIHRDHVHITIKN